MPTSLPISHIFPSPLSLLSWIHKHYSCNSVIEVINEELRLIFWIHPFHCYIVYCRRLECIGPIILLVVATLVQNHNKSSFRSLSPSWISLHSVFWTLLHVKEAIFILTSLSICLLVFLKKKIVFQSRCSLLLSCQTKVMKLLILYFPFYFFASLMFPYFDWLFRSICKSSFLLLVFF